MEMTLEEVGRMSRTGNRRVIVELFEDLVSKYGEEHGEGIINMIVGKCGGIRLTFPGFEELYRLGRDRVIRRQFQKGNVSITALMVEHNLSRPQVKRILSGEE